MDGLKDARVESVQSPAGAAMRYVTARGTPRHVGIDTGFDSGFEIECA
jgi:hypothetical protein